MVTSFIEETSGMKRARFATGLVLGAAMIGLSACAQSTLRLSPDFGDAETADLAAQIADPDAHYKGTPAPGASNGARVGLAQTRYEKNQVIKPSSTAATSPNTIAGGGDNSGSSGGGGGAGVGVGAAGQ
jgi:hypothetical protein